MEQFNVMTSIPHRYSIKHALRPSLPNEAYAGFIQGKQGKRQKGCAILGFMELMKKGAC